MFDSTDRAVRDVLAHGGLDGDLEHSELGWRLGAMLQSGTAGDVYDGAGPGEVLEALRAAASDPELYTRLLELIVLAGLHDARLLSELPSSDIAPLGPEPVAPPPRRTRSRPRRR